VRVLIAPDGFGGTLSAREAAAAIADGWERARPDDELAVLPLSDGGEGLLDVVAGPRDTWLITEVVGPLGQPVDAALLLRADGSGLIESAAACGLHLVPDGRRDVAVATTFGVGELLDAAREAGVTRLLVGLGGSATIDGGTGALLGLGFRLQVADGSGLKIGGADLPRLARVERGWSADYSSVAIELLADVTTPLSDSARRFGPQKGADAAQVERSTAALLHWAEVAERDLGAPAALRDTPGTGAAGGLGYGLAAALGARFVAGAARVGELVGLPAAVGAAELIITGEGRLDATTAEGKVVDHVARLAAEAGRRVVAVVGQVTGDHVLLADVEAAAPDGEVVDAFAEVAAAAERLAHRIARADAE
jgi:glycerate 2-kinase